MSKDSVEFVVTSIPRSGVQLPQSYVNTDLDPNYDRSPEHIVLDGQNLQAGMDNVMPGEILEIAADTAAAAEPFILREQK